MSICWFPFYIGEGTLHRTKKVQSKKKTRNEASHPQTLVTSSKLPLNCSNDLRNKNLTTVELEIKNKRLLKGRESQGRTIKVPNTNEVSPFFLSYKLITLTKLYN